MGGWHSAVASAGGDLMLRSGRSCVASAGENLGGWSGVAGGGGDLSWRSGHSAVASAGEGRGGPLKISHMLT